MSLNKMVAVVLFLIQGLLSAQYYEGSLGEIVVYENKEGSEVSNFNLKSLEKGGNTYLSDILKNEPEVDIRRRTAVGDTSDILSIRGLSSNRLLLNLNGRSLNAAGMAGRNYIDWSTIPLDNIEEVQVIKGGSDMKYGNNALGGVINIKTRRPTEKMNTGLFASYGIAEDVSYIQNYRAYNSRKIGFFGYSISGSYSKSDEFLWNNDYEGKNIGGNFTFDMPYEGNMEIGAQYTKTTRGFIRNNRKSPDPSSPLFYQKVNDDYPLASGEPVAPGNGNVPKPGPGAFRDKEKTYLDFSYKQPFGSVFSEMKIYKNIENRFEKNYSSHLIKPGYPDGLLVLNRKVESDRSWGASFSLSGEKASISWETGAEYKYLGYGDVRVYFYDRVYNSYSKDDKLYSSKPARHEGKVLAYYAKNKFALTENLSILAGIRYDDYRVDPIHGSNMKHLRDSDLSSSLGLSFKASEKDLLSVNAYIKSRTPDMPEVNWWSNGATQGTNDLKPEKNHAVEFSGSHKFSKDDYLTLSAYNYNIDKYIMFRFDVSSDTVQGQRAVYNIDNVKIYGISASYRGKSFDKIAYYANVSFQKSKKGYDEYGNVLKRLDYMPELKSNLGAEYELRPNSTIGGSWKFVDNQKAVYSYKSGSSSFNHKAVTLSSYSIFSLEYRLKYNKNLELSAYCENLFNESYSERYGYPMTGRTAGMTAKVTF